MSIDFQILKRLYKSYTKKYLRKILLSVFFTIILAGSTSSVAYLLDPAIDQLFIKQNQKMLYLIPGLIILAFAAKGISLYFTKTIFSFALSCSFKIVEMCFKLQSFFLQSQLLQ